MNDPKSFSGVRLDRFCEACRKVIARMTDGREIAVGGFCNPCWDEMDAASNMAGGAPPPLVT
jgi:hypothetical protein